MAPARGASATSDTGAKHPRTFQCRDLLWEALEQMAGELECTVDFLLNDAVKHYLRQRQRMAPPQPPPSARPPLERVTPRAQMAPPMPPLPPQPVFAAARTAPPPVPPAFVAPMAPPMAPMAPRPPLPPPPGFMPPLPSFGPRGAPPVPPPYRGGPPPVLPVPPGFGAPPGFAAPPVSMPMAPMAPPLMAPPPVPMAPAPMAPTRLVVTYGEQMREVDRPGFIIGRGKQASGLTIKDPNISRCHATIEQQDGVYYLVDMGSTNGTQVNGQGIQRKPIVEGDVARICDHEIRFSYRRMP